MGYERPRQAIAYIPKELEVLVKVLSPVSLVIDRMEEYLLSANVQYGLFIRWAELLKSVEKHERRRPRLWKKIMFTIVTVGYRKLLCRRNDKFVKISAKH